MKKLFLLFIFLGVILEACNTNKPACGNRRAHKQRHKEMVRKGMFM